MNKISPDIPAILASTEVVDSKVNSRGIGMLSGKAADLVKRPCGHARGTLAYGEAGIMHE